MFNNKQFDGKNIQTFMAIFHHETQRESLLKHFEKNGARVCAVITVPCWNIYGQIIGDDYAIIYQASKEISYEVLT